MNSASIFPMFTTVRKINPNATRNTVAPSMPLMVKTMRNNNGEGFSRKAHNPCAAYAMDPTAHPPATIRPIKAGMAECARTVMKRR